MTDLELEARYIAKVRASLVAAGAREDQISVQYADDLQDYEAIVSAPSSQFSDEQVDELSKLHGFPHITFSDQALWQRVADVRSDRSIEQSKAWLAERGLLEALPNYDPSRHSLADYGEALEAFCGLEVGSVLATDLPGILRFAHFSENHSAMEILGHAAAASNLRVHRIAAGFVGYDLSAEADQAEGGGES